MAVGVRDVVIDTAPTNPDDGEQVIEVRMVEPAEARRLLVSDGDWLADLIDLAVDRRG
jgi:8-oxo-dGTP diphosphatase